MKPQIHLLTAHVKLLHMADYSGTMIRMMSYGLLKATEDDGYFRDSIKQLAPHLEGQRLEEVTELKQQMDFKTALNGAKAAGLIFMHTGLEGCLEELAAFDSKENPTDWAHLCSQKKVPLRDVLDKPQSEILQALLEDYIHKFERDSLLEKINAMLSVLKPASGKLQGYSYDESRLSRIDRLRNDCAHGRVDVSDFSQVYNDIEYLRSTGEFFVALLAEKHQVALDLKILPN